MQAEIDAGRAARRGQDVALVDVEHPRIDSHIRVGTGKIVTLRPVRGGSSTFEQAGFRQDERARAERDDAASSCVRAAQGVEHLGRHRLEPVGRGDHHGLDPACSLQPERRMDPQAAVGRHGGTAGAADEKPVPGEAEVRQIVAPEDVARDTELEHPDPVVDDDRHVPGCPRRHPA